MKIFANILTFLLVISVPAFLVLISFSFTEATSVAPQFDEKSELIPYTVMIKDTENGKQTLEKTKIETLNTDGTVPLDSSGVGYIEFGKLATAFFMANQSGTLSFKNMSLSGTILTIDPQYSSIVSLYDPFSVYSIASVYGDFSVTQVTNGSLYIGRERDGTYSLYSIDSVVRLDFLHNGERMTDMVLFPGMYIRFDPKMNRALLGANLFRILQSLEPNGTEDVSIESTGIEFVNPRMNTKNEKDSFLMYRLPTQTRLFKMLHILFYERVSQIDLYKEYGTAIGVYSDETSAHPYLINPGKKSHLLLLKLDGILANALKNPVSIDAFKKDISDISNSAHSLTLGNAVDGRLERFLTDGRFALFGGTKNLQFADIYQAASEAVGKAPVTPHAKLLQRLSDIYSTNLVTQKKDLSFANIDTYTPTATELEKTLQSTAIQQRDYFDIALYAFNVLKKMEDRSIFTEEAIHSHSTYTLIQTVLVSTDRYVKDIDDTERKTITYEGITLHFYLHILSALTHSVYGSFMESENGMLFLKSAYRPTKNEERIRVDESLIRDMSNLESMLLVISERMDEHYGLNSKNATYLNIKRHIALYSAFVRLLDYEYYMEYQQTPYLVDDSADTLMPLYENEQIVRYDPTKQIESNTVTDDPNIATIRSILGNIATVDIKKEVDGYYVNNAQLTLTSTDGTQMPLTMNIVLSDDIQTFSNPVFSYKGRTIYLLTDKNNVRDLSEVMGLMPAYITRLDSILAGNPGLLGGVRFLDTTKKIAIGTYIFPLVP